MKKTYLLLLVFWLCNVMAFAQQLTITGKVVDAADNSPLMGATITIKGQSGGTVSDLNGNYSIKAKKGETILFSFVGMKPKTAVIGNKSVINVSLESSQELDEVVVIGYGSVRKSDLTGSVGSLKTDDVLKTNPSSINQALQGRLAGVQVNQNDGAPGGAVSIQIRGANSFSTSSEPLYVVDGIPFDTGGTPVGGAGRAVNALSFINAQDIESIEVLKDASATAIYGSRGANGVVLIQTKKGKKGNDRIEVSATFGTSKLVNKVKFLDGHDYAQYRNEMQRNHEIYNGMAFSTPIFAGYWYTNEEVGYDYYNPAPQDFKNGYMNGGMNWLDVIIQNAYTQDYNLSFSGADDKGSYHISGNFFDQQGTIVGSGFTRGNIRMNIDRNLNKYISAGANLNATRSETQFANTNWQAANVFSTALYYPPTSPLFDPATKDLDSQLSFFSSNPYSFVHGSHDMVYTNNIFASAYAEVKILNSLKFRQKFGYSYTYNQREAYSDRTTWGGRPPTNGFAEQADNWYQGITVESLLSYNKSFGKNHRVDAVGAFTYEQSDFGNKWMSNYDFPNDFTLMYNMAAGIGEKRIGSGRGQGRLMSWLARANYSLYEKYLLTASYRLDGSSKFAPGRKWADFYSFALAWKMSEEQFIKNLNLFSTLKLRGSYGETGSQAISNYQTLEILNNAVIDTDGKLQSGYAEAVWKGPLNKNLIWETTSQYNVGIDIGFVDNRFNLTVDLYKKVTRDLLQSLIIPPSSGFSSIKTNYGFVHNKGLEIAAQAYILTKTAIKWDINANIYFNRNEIRGLKGDQFAEGLYFGLGDVFIQRNGCPIGTIYGYVEDGFYDSEAEIRANPEYATKPDNFIKSKIGEVKYKNLDNDPTSISNTDRTIIGDVNPDYQFGFTNNLAWKNLTFSFFLQGSIGGDIINANLHQRVNMTDIGNIPQFAYDERWTPENTANAKFPKPYAGLDRAMLFSRRYIEDGSYVRLKNVNIGYTFHKPVKAISNINIYANATNLFTITKYRWFDPDVNAFGSDPSRRGVDASSYPSAMTFSVGVKLGF